MVGKYTVDRPMDPSWIILEQTLGDLSLTRGATLCGGAARGKCEPELAVKGDQNMGILTLRAPRLKRTCSLDNVSTNIRWNG